MSPVNRCSVPSTSATTEVTVRPVSSVSSRRTSALRTRSTLSCCSAGRTATTSASAVVLELAEVALPEPVQRGPVELRGAADEVVHLGLERLAVAVEPAVGGHVPVVDEDGCRVPVLDLAGEPVTAFQDQDALAGRC